MDYLFSVFSVISESVLKVDFQRMFFDSYVLTLCYSCVKIAQCCRCMRFVWLRSCSSNWDSTFLGFSESVSSSFLLGHRAGSPSWEEEISLLIVTQLDSEDGRFVEFAFPQFCRSEGSW